MRISINRNSETPLYRQIGDYFRKAIRSGLFEPGARLPSGRELAADLGVNRITVETAYGELEAEGLIARRVGEGTTVIAPDSAPHVEPVGSSLPLPLWQTEPAREIPGAVRGNRIDSLPGMPIPAGIINFSSGGGDPRLFPVREFRAVMNDIIRDEGNRAMEYCDPRGYPPLREALSRILASQGTIVDPGEILVTAGSQQGISLACQTLIRPGDTVLTEAPTYGEALNLFRLMGVSVTAIPVDTEGMDMERMEEAVRTCHPRLIYVIPTFQNPSGACMSGRRRRQLLAAADRYNIPILEDDFVGDLRYDGKAQPPLRGLDPGGGVRPGGRVIYVSTFSKMLMPGLRVGFISASGPVLDWILERKRVTDLSTSGLIQRALEKFVTVGRYQAFLRRSRQLYRIRRDAMMEAVGRHLPRCSPVCDQAGPRGGLFLWLRLPPGSDSETLLAGCVKKGVSFAPGTLFFPDRSEGREFIRLNFASATPSEIEKGIRIIGEAASALRR